MNQDKGIDSALQFLAGGEGYGLLMQAPAAIAVVSGQDHVFELANPRYEQLIGKTRIIGKPGREAIPEIESQGIWDIFDQVYKTGEPFTGNEVKVHLNRAVHGASETGYFNFVVQPISNGQDGIRRIMVYAVEVTEQVLARKKAEKSEERLKLAVKTSKLGTWEFRPGKGGFICSEESRTIFGFSLTDEIEVGVFVDHIHPEDKDQVRRELGKLMEGAGDQECEVRYRILPGNKSMRWVRTCCKIYFDHLKVDRLIGTIEDITEDRLFEESLLESELRARLAIESAALGSFDWNLVTQYFFNSPRVIEIFGFGDNPETTHQQLIDSFHPEDKPVRDQAVKESFEKGGLKYEARVIWPDKSIHWVRVHGKVIYDTAHEPVRMYGIVMDTTETKNQSELLEKKVVERSRSLQQKNEELKRSEERFHKMIMEVQDYAIILLDTNGTILNWNIGAQKIKGYEEKEIIGRDFSIFYLPDDIQNGLPQRLIKEATEKGRATHEGWRVRKGGTLFWGSMVLTALHNDQNDVIGFSKVTRNLDERKIAEDKMKQYLSDLEFQNKELEQFAYVASHDLQEPLRKIQTFSGLLQQYIQNDTAKKYLDKIHHASERMTALIRSVLNYSRLSSTDGEFVKTDLNTILNDVKLDFELLISEKNAIITSDNLPKINGIPIQLNQLFYNLISNALKFSDKAPVISITSRIIGVNDSNRRSFLKFEKNYAELIIKDNGIGFDQEYANKIFTIFQRLHGYQSYPGTGIGLALCKRIVTNHHGFLTAKGEPGKGASFYVYLPMDDMESRIR